MKTTLIPLFPVPGSAGVPPAVFGVPPKTPAAPEDKRTQSSPNASYRPSHLPFLLDQGEGWADVSKPEMRPPAPVPGSAGVPPAVFAVPPKTPATQEDKRTQSSPKMPYRPFCLTLLLLTLLPFLTPALPAAEAPLIAPTFPVYILYQLGSTNLCKYSYGEFTNECLPMYHIYRNMTTDISASEVIKNSSDCPYTMNTTATYSFAQHDAYSPVPGTYVSYDPYPVCDLSDPDFSYTVSITDSCSGSASVVTDPSNPDSECSSTRDTSTCSLDFTGCWDGWFHHYTTILATTTSVTPTEITTVYTVNSNIVSTGSCNSTNDDVFTRTVTSTVSDEYITSDLTGTTIPFDDPTWYYDGLAYGGIDPSERCALLVGMNYMFWFIAPAGRPFNFQYDERFIPDDSTVPSSIIKIGTASGVGTGQWQSWGPVQSLPHFYTVTSGGCTFTRGGTTIVEIPAGSGVTLGNDPGGPGGPGGPGNPGPGDPVDPTGPVGGCGSCSCSSTPGGVSASVEGVNVKLNLGGGQYGQTQGTLVVTETNCTTALFTPATLHYLGGFTNVQVIPDGSGHVRQVYAPQTFADVITDSGTAYEIRLYAAPLPTSMSGGLYVPIGTPATVVKIQQLTTTNQLQLSVIDNLNSVTNFYEYVWNPTTHGWALTSGGGFRQDVVAWSSSGLIKTNSILNASSQPVYLSVTYYEALTSGLAQTQKVVDPAGAALTSKWFYYDNNSTDGTNYGKLKISISASGFWQSYQYDINGLITNLTSQFLNAPTNASPTNCRVVSYYYTNINSSLYAQTVIETLLGQEISRTYYLTYPSEELIIRCQTPGAAWNAANNLITTNTYVSGGEFAGRIQSIANPDGTMSIYQYYDGTYYLDTTVSTGQPNTGGTAIIDGTQTVNTVNDYGGFLGQITTDIKSTITTQSAVSSTSDPLARPEQVQYLDYTSDYISYACCGPDNTTARDGTVTYYYYDPLRRQTASVVNSITTTNILDPAGRLLATIRIGSSGGQITNSMAAYDIAGRIMSQTNALGGVTKTTNIFDGYGQMVVTNTNPDGGTQISTYAQDGSLLSVGGAAVSPVGYIYGVDSNGVFTITVKLTSTGGTNEWTKTYSDMIGRAYMTVYAGATNNPFAISYFNNAGQLSKEFDPDGIITLYAYNAKGEQAYTVQDMNQNSNIDYGGSDRITFTTNDVYLNTTLSLDLQRSRTYVFATNGTTYSNLISTDEMLVSGLESWHILWNGGVGITNRSQTVYDGSGTVTITDTAPDGSYHVSVSQSGQAYSDTSYDSNSVQLAQVTYAYDQYGRQNSVSDARNGTSSFTFNNAGQINSTLTPVPGTGANAQLTTNFFDSMSRATGMRFPDGTSVTNLYFVTGQLKQTSGSRTYPIGYGYDAQGRVTSMTNWSTFPSAGMRVTTWNYDAYRGFLSSKTYDGGAAGPTYAYTGAGRFFTRLWARGIYTTNVYDPAGELSATAYSDGTTPSVLFGFDRRGRKISITNGAIVTTISYNDQNKELAESYSGGQLNGFSVTNGFDFLLRRTNVAALGTGLRVASLYRYDAASRLASVSDGTNSATYSYLANSPLVSQIAFTNNSSLRMTTTKNYDYLNRLTSISSANASSVVLDSHGYAYNSANQRTIATNADGTYWIYKYDTLGQVTSGVKYWPDNTVVAGQQFGYAFDNVGNRQTSSVGGDQWGSNHRYENYTANTLNQYTDRTIPGAVDIIGVATNTADVTVNNQATYRKGSYFRAQLPINNASSPAFQSVTNLAVLHEGTNSEILTNVDGNVLLPPSEQSFSYDADGNTTNDSVWMYFWDGQNQLVQMKSVSSLPRYAQRKLDFTYDFMGRRIQKIVSTNSGSAWVPISTNLFIYDGWNMAAEVDGEGGGLIRSYRWGVDLGNRFQSAGGISGLLTIGCGTNGVNYLTYDGNGNVATLVNSSNGTIVTQYGYSPFGDIILLLGSAASGNPFRFSTKFEDCESSLVYYERRYYDPSVGKWLSRDPMGERGGFNLYETLRNDPINFFDPFGETPCTSGCGYDVTTALARTLSNVEGIFNLWSDNQAYAACVWIINPFTAGDSWDIFYLRDIGFLQSQNTCDRTVTFNGGCYYGGAANYALWGKMFRLCGRRFGDMVGNPWSLGVALEIATFWKWNQYKHFGNEEAEALAFTVYGYSGLLPHWSISSTCTPSKIIAKQYAFAWRWMPNKPQ